MRRTGATLALVLTLLTPVVSAPPASACSCAPLEPRDALLRADGAVIGRVTDIRDGGPERFGSPSRVTTIAVEEEIKGDLGDEIEVLGGVDGGSCGLEVGEGARVALILSIDDGHWSSSLCATSTPRALRTAAMPLPAPDGHGPIRFVVGGDFGEARLVALDAEGRTLAYGWGQGDTYDVAVCPGGERIVEGFAQGDLGAVAVRDTATLEVVRRVPLLRARFPSVYHVACLDPEGRSIVAIEGGANEIRVFAVDGAEADEVFTSPGSGWLASISGGVPYVEPRGEELLAVNVATGETTPVLEGVRLPGEPVVSPDGRYVAAHRIGHEGGVSSLEVWSTAPVDRVVTIRLERRFRHGRLRWTDDDTIVFDSIAGQALVLDLSPPMLVGKVHGWWATDPTVVDGALVGATDGGGEGALLRSGLAGLVGDPPEELPIVAGQVYALAAVPGAIDAEPGAPPAAPDLGQGGTASPTIATSSGVPWLGIGLGVALVFAAVGAQLLIARRRAAAHATR